MAPSAEPQELVVLARNPSQPTTVSSYPDYCYLRDNSRSYAGLIAFWSGGVTRFSLPGGSDSSRLDRLGFWSAATISRPLGYLLRSGGCSTPPTTRSPVGCLCHPELRILGTRVWSGHKCDRPRHPAKRSTDASRRCSAQNLYRDERGHLARRVRTHRHAAYVLAKRYSSADQP